MHELDDTLMNKQKTSIDVDVSAHHHNSLKCLTLLCDLDLDPRPSKPNLFIWCLNYINNQSLVVCKIKC